MFEIDIIIVLAVLIGVFAKTTVSSNRLMNKIIDAILHIDQSIIQQNVAYDKLSARIDAQDAKIARLDG
jgi:CII-binding regulator of phage lambda lysogenization HflD